MPTHEFSDHTIYATERCHSERSEGPGKDSLITQCNPRTSQTLGRSLAAARDDKPGAVSTSSLALAARPDVDCE
ncbi:MAG: hypothetical protein JWO45_1359 [Spartobacteria bacterium]|nr:hypothetical protein [Spartobacteria bacterium]